MGARFDTDLGSFRGSTSVTEQSLGESLFGPVPCARVLLTEIDGRPVGFALYYFRFSSFAGRPSLWLEDLYVDPESRNSGAGRELVQELMAISRRRNCTHMGWTADAKNEKALRFYNRLGAVITETHGRDHTFRLGIDGQNTGID